MAKLIGGRKVALAKWLPLMQSKTVRLPPTGTRLKQQEGPETASICRSCNKGILRDQIYSRDQQLINKEKTAFSRNKFPWITQFQRGTTLEFLLPQIPTSVMVSLQMWELRDWQTMLRKYAELIFKKNLSPHCHSSRPDKWGSKCQAS